MSNYRPTRTAYDEWADTYDEDPNLTRDLDAVALRNAPLALDNAVVIELGAGTGKNSSYLGRRASKVIALDQSTNMLARARVQVTSANVEFIEADITKPWPVPSRSSGFVVANLVLEHISDLAPVFREARRVLAAGGVFYVAELHPYKQLLGSRARYVNASGSEIQVEAFSHSVSKYIGVALEQGFKLQHIAELRSEAEETQVPRLLQLIFEAV